MARPRTELRWTLTTILTLALLLPQLAWAHCDALDGPVVVDARSALAQQDVTPVLKWVRAEDEAQIRSAFAQALAVRQLGPEAQTLADAYFFETLVRVHRAGEGAPYTGLKPAGTIEPAIVKADHALEAGSIDPLAETVAEHVAQGLRERFARAAETRKHAAESVQAGREYIEAYSAYVHYMEEVASLIHGEHPHPEAETRR